jgi:hypothetical protein
VNTKSKHHALMASILLVALVLGCATTGGYGTMRVVESGGMTVQTLVNNWEDYKVYSAGIGNLAAAVVFDPKNDGKTLNMGSRWVRVTDQNSLNAQIGLLAQRPGAGGMLPRLWTILGPDGSAYGYVFTILDHLVIDVIDNNTMLVEDLS